MRGKSHQGYPDSSGGSKNEADRLVFKAFNNDSFRSLSVLASALFHFREIPEGL